MPQRRLEHYFVPSRAPFIPTGCSFLDLPHSVRKLIYEYAGLDRLLVDLNYSNLKVYRKGTYPETRDCRKLDANGWYDLKKLAVAEMDELWEINSDSEDVKGYGTSLWGNAYGTHQSMLLASKQIHQEVEAFIYAGAVFRVCLGQPLGFTRLWRMSDNALSNLGSLTIRLDVPKTVVWNSAWGYSPTPPKHIDLATKWGTLVLKNWILTLERLVRSVRPGQLRLRVVFHAKTMGDARAVIEPMMRLPLLKDCGICAELHGQSCWWKQKQDGYYHSQYYDKLRPTREDTEISRLVQQTIRKLTLVRDRDPAPFRYLDLPQELRFAILEYTDLVSPDAVQWRPRKWIPRSPSCTYCTNGYRTAIKESESPCFCHCFPGPNIDDHIQWYPCCEDCSPEEYSSICYCSSRGPIWSSSCKCRFPPQILFTVSSQVRQDAISVYYASNRILVTPYNSPVIRLLGFDDGRWPAAGIHFMPKIELSLYLSSIAHNALQHIRWLEWILPSSQRTYLLPSTPAWLDYLDTLLLMQDTMNMSALTFTINISASGMLSSDNDYDWNICLPLNEDAWTWYDTIILPVRRLGEAGLKDFFVHLRHLDIETGRREIHEQNLEKMVMGKDYNSTGRGKPAERVHKMFDDWRAEREFRTTRG